VDVIPEGGDRYTTSKKKLLMLAKIFTRNWNKEYHEQISACIKDTS
jgi:hypothetical protein